TDHGDVALQAEFERDILLTQRWVLQPRIEVEWWLSDQPDLGIENGDASSAVDLRLRYEFKRKFAPYIGLSWQDASNGTSSTSVVGGLRFWF
ncbi:MAG: copper resistance protein B, partial [Gammaproteobacteria bacterium]|nr:copper resistance protein B [Gammaproteobacteria bacterium]